MNLTLTFTSQELDYIASLLAKQPWFEVNALLVNIQKQVTDQQQQAAKERTNIPRYDPNVTPIHPSIAEAEQDVLKMAPMS